MAGGLFDASRLYNVLKEADLLPTWTQRKSPETGYSGFYPELNRLFADKGARNDVAHEMTHAVQRNVLEATASSLAEKQKKSKLSKQEQQFINAYNQLLNRTYGVAEDDTAQREKINNNFKQSLDALYNKRNQAPDAKFDAYRTRPNELQAWGVDGYSSRGAVNKDVPTHVDPTYTTEFDILLSMYQKLPPALRQLSAQQRKAGIAADRGLRPEQDNTLHQSGFSTDLFEDPFRPMLR